MAPSNRLCYVRIFARTNVRELCNEVAILRRDDESICLAGLDSMSGRPDLARVISRLPASRTGTIFADARAGFRRR